MNNDDFEDDDEIEYVSKSQMKRDMHALQDLGTKLVELSNDKLLEMDLPEDLLNAIQECKRINARGGHRRQLQYIGKLMRRADADDIQQQYDKLTAQSAETVNQLHKLENWRTRLLESGDAALAEFVQEYPTADRQQIRQLVRAAGKEQHDAKAKNAYRSLFQLLKTYIT